MSGQSPAVVLYSSDGIELAVTPGVPIPDGTRTILVGGSDGTNIQNQLMDGYGRQVVVGPGTAGFPTGGVLTIQGEVGGIPIPIVGTITATNASTSPVNTFPPPDATFMGALVNTVHPSYGDGYMEPLSLTLDGALRVDGSGVTQPVSGTVTVTGTVTANIGTTGGLALDSTLTGGTAKFEMFDGTNILGTPAHPVRTDPTGTTTQPVSGVGTFTVAGTVVSNQGAAAALSGAWPVKLTDGYGQLFGEPNNPINVTGTFNNSSVGLTGAVPPIDATYMGALATTAAESGLTSGDMYPLNITTTGQLRIDSAYPKATAVATAVDMTQVGGVATTAAPVYTTATVNPLSLDTSGNLRVTGTVTTNKAASSSVTSVSVAANSNNVLLASNANRIFASVFNNTNKTLFIKLGTTANATTSYTMQVFSGSYWEVPNDWTGEIDAFAPSSASGNILITELSP